MSVSHGSKPSTSDATVSRRERLNDAQRRARRRNRAWRYDWRAELRDVANLLSVRRFA